METASRGAAEYLCVASLRSPSLPSSKLNRNSATLTRLFGDTAQSCSCVWPAGASRWSSLPRRSPSSTRRGSACLPIRSDGGQAEEKTPFGYTRKDVLLIGVGLTVFGVGLKSGLELIGVDSLKAGNVVQLVMVLGLTVGWISTYVFRVSNKEMTYAQQLRDYENKVMEKRLEELPEAELETLLAQVEEEKRQLKLKREESI